MPRERVRFIGDGRVGAMTTVSLADYSGLPSSRREDLARELAGQTSLERVLAWCRSREPPLKIESILTADEYSHDVLVPLEGGRYLVYDVT